MFAPSCIHNNRTILMSRVNRVNIVQGLLMSSACAKMALTFSLVPLAPVESARSLPAKSTRLILLTCRQMLIYFRGITNNLYINHSVINTKYIMNMLRASSDLFCRKVCFAVVFFLREDDCENGVGPAAGLIHVGGSHSSGRLKKVRK